MTVTLKEFTSDFTAEEHEATSARLRAMVQEELTLRDLRHARNLTQARMAELMGVEQENVPRLERGADLLLSTLGDYVAAMGGQLRLIAEFPNRQPVAIALSDLVEAPPPKRRATARSRATSPKAVEA